jgi:hypothetical protein
MTKTEETDEKFRSALCSAPFSIMCSAGWVLLYVHPSITFVLCYVLCYVLCDLLCALLCAVRSSLLCSVLFSTL